ncbi:DUF485 domain-containing protein [Massilia sp. PAMC28688]|uniref:DUF485 domain-containing protein n=1 Tax=Massilia sp. PAMC28688 TaxID=2861283 RepID=UPI001C62EA64|nr:DUF485 domain-containing protein [Massilia sp. PAMC28688]QYF91769.1 DUF485 domain-containing protein [Massilia sp. PAMC28688]
MNHDLVHRIESNPHYVQLVRDRTRFGWLLTLSMLLVYYGFILLIAFNKELLSIRIGSGVTTTGIPVGLFVIVFTVVVTGIYVRHANGIYDELTAAIHREVQ